MICPFCAGSMVVGETVFCSQCGIVRTTVSRSATPEHDSLIT
jgi:hypothetical protein